MKRFAGLICVVVVFGSAWAAGRQQSKPLKPNPKPEVSTLIDLANTASKAYKFDEAIAQLHAGISKAMELGDLYGTGRCWQLIGNANYAKGDLIHAEECFSQAKSWYEKAGDKDDELGMLGNLAILKDNTGHPDEARPIYLQLLQRYKDQADSRGIAQMSLNLAILEFGTSHLTACIQYADEAYKRYRELGDVRLEASALTESAIALSQMGKKDEAIQHYRTAIELAHRAGYKATEANAWGNLGTTYQEQQKLVQALVAYQHARELHQVAKDLRNESYDLTQIATTNDLLGQRSVAIDLLRQSCEIEKKLGDRRGLAVSEANLGVVLHEDGQNQESAVKLNEALVLHRESHDLYGEGSCLGTLGGVLSAQSKLPEALAAENKALEIFRKLGSSENEGTILDDLATIRYKLGQFSAAESNDLVAIQIYQSLGNGRFEATAWGHLGQAQVRLGKDRDAEKSFRHAIGLVESVRNTLATGSSGRTEFFGDRLAYFHDYLDLLIRSKRIPEAFDLVQKMKARSLLELAGDGSDRLVRGLDSGEAAKDVLLRKTAADLNAAMVKEGAENAVGAKVRFKALKAQLIHAESTLTAFENDLYARHPELAVRLAAKSSNLHEIGTALPPNSALLEFVWGAQPQVFVVRRSHGTTRITVHRIGSSDGQLAALAARVRMAVSNPKNEFLGACREGYEAILHPLHPALAGCSKVFLCPDGPLWDVPFQALWLNRFAIDKWEIDYATSGTAWLETVRHAPASTQLKPMLLVANPDFGGVQRFGDNPAIEGQRPIETPSRPIETPSRPIETPSRPIETPSRDLQKGLRLGIIQLPGTQQEADAIHRLIPGADELTGRNAQEKEFLRIAGNYRIIHVATHAFINDASPMLSSVVLAKPERDGTTGYLTARDILGLELKADLVVLSACNTGRGQANAGEGLLGLSWALFAAGSPSQVVSQWSVDDRATAALMPDFYHFYLHGASIGKALRKAEQRMRRKPDHPQWAHPYYWAPFIAIGGWRQPRY